MRILYVCIIGFVLFAACDVFAQDILTAVKDGDLAKVQTIITNAPRQVYAVDEDSMTTVHLAVIAGNVEILKLLYENGASLEKQNVNGETPLHYAAYMGKTPIAKYLLQNKVAIEQKTDYGKSALDFAYFSEDPETIQLLRDNGAYEPPVPLPDVLQLSDKIYRILIPLEEAPNSIIYTGNNSVLLVDTGWLRTGKVLKQYIEDMDNGQIEYLINTHLHPDHKGGNSIVDPNTIHIHEKNLEECAAKGIITPANGKLMGRTGKYFDTYYTMQYNGEQIHIIPSPGVHTEDDMIVHFTDAKVVHMGDLLITESFPSVTVEVDEYIAILEKIQDIFPDGTTLVGGHGKVFAMHEVQEYKEMIVDVLRFVREGIHNNRTKEDITKDTYLKQYEAYNTFIPMLGVDYWIEAIFRNEEQRNQ